MNFEVGSGAQKIVYKAIDTDTGCEVAWNSVNLSQITDYERRRLTEEITLIKQLRHPNIIHCEGAWVVKKESKCIFITELLTGGSLKQFLRKIKHPRRKVLKLWCKGILSGIEYLHTQKPPVLHRDLKCDNIFIDSTTGSVRIGDLGLSTAMQRSELTSFLGTPEYMSPEVIEGKYGVEADIYAFGLCIIEMCTLKKPYFECKTQPSVLKKILSGDKPKGLQAIQDVELRKFIELCLAPPCQRPTARELLKHSFLIVNEASSAEHEPIPIDHFLLEEETYPKKIPLSFIIRNSNGNPTHISFEYDLEYDTPYQVANELIAALEISSRACQEISAQIEKLIESKIKRSTCSRAYRSSINYLESNTHSTPSFTKTLYNTHLCNQTHLKQTRSDILLI